MSMHVPARPAWTCGACRQAWPCPTRQRELAAEYSGAQVSLMLYLSEHFVQACSDLPAARAGVLYRQFFLWPYQSARNAR